MPEFDKNAMPIFQKMETKNLYRERHGQQVVGAIFFILVWLTFILLWKDPDLLDAVIRRVMYGTGPIATEKP